MTTIVTCFSRQETSLWIVLPVYRKYFLLSRTSPAEELSNQGECTTAEATDWHRIWWDHNVRHPSMLACQDGIIQFRLCTNSRAHTVQHVASALDLLLLEL